MKTRNEQETTKRPDGIDYTMVNFAANFAGMNVFNIDGETGMRVRELMTMGHVRIGKKGHRNSADKNGVYIMVMTAHAATKMDSSGLGPRRSSAVGPPGPCSCAAWRKEIVGAPANAPPGKTSYHIGDWSFVIRAKTIKEVHVAVMRMCFLQLCVGAQARLDEVERLLKVTKATMTFLNAELRFGDVGTMPWRRAMNAMIDGREYGWQATETPARRMLVARQCSSIPAGVKAGLSQRERDAKGQTNRVVAGQPLEDASLQQDLTSFAWMAAPRRGRTCVQELTSPQLGLRLGSRAWPRVVWKGTLEEATLPRHARVPLSATAFLCLPTIPTPTFLGRVVL